MERLPQQPNKDQSVEQLPEQIEEEKVEDRLKLSGELVEKILEKTKNINENGTAFTVVDEYSPDRFAGTRKWKTEAVLRNKKTYEQFKKEYRIPHGKYHFISESHSPDPDQAYNTYTSILKEGAGSYRDSRLKEWGFDRMGLSLDKPTPKAKFIEKYNIEFKRQSDELEEIISKQYQEYLEDLEDQIHGASLERFTKKYKSKQLSRGSRREGLLMPWGDSVEADMDSLYEIYLELMAAEEDGNPEYYEYSRICSSHVRDYQRKLMNLGLYKPADDGQARIKEIDHADYEDPYGDYPREASSEIEGNFVRTQSEVISKEDFTKRYREALENQDRQLDIEAAKFYKEYISEFNESKFKSEDLHRLKLILERGIFGGRKIEKQNPVSMVPSEWAKDVRKKKTDRKVYFNIMGNFHNDFTIFHNGVADEALRGKFGMGDSFFFRKNYHKEQPNNGVAIIFDKKGLSYHADDDSYSFYKDHPASARRRTPDSQWGYAGPSRIAPRRFEGIVISCTDTIKRNEEGREVNVEIYSTDKTKWEMVANDIAQVMMGVDKDHPERLLPIYDIYGNMLWPVKMSKEEIQEKISAKKLVSSNKLSDLDTSNRPLE